MFGFYSTVYIILWIINRCPDDLSLKPCIHHCVMDSIFLMSSDSCKTSSNKNFPLFYVYSWNQPGTNKPGVTKWQAPACKNFIRPARQAKCIVLVICLMVNWGFHIMILHLLSLDKTFDFDDHRQVPEFQKRRSESTTVKIKSMISAIITRSSSSTGPGYNAYNIVCVETLGTTIKCRSFGT